MDTVIVTILLSHESALSPDFKILGVSLLDRFFLPARKQGFMHFKVIFCGANDAISEKMRNLYSDRIQFEVVSSENDLPEKFVLCYPSFLLLDSVWARLRNLETKPETVHLFEQIDSCFVFSTIKKQFIFNSLKECQTDVSLVKQCVSVLEINKIGVQSDDEWIPVQSESDVSRTEKKLMQSLVKKSEGFMSRHLERKISLWITRQLIHTRVTPNGMTMVSLLVGLIGSLFFIFSQTRNHLIGALLFWAHSVLDGCDGEIARLKFLESRWGGILDFWSDNVVHSAVFSAIACGWMRNEDSVTPMILGVLAVVGTLLSALTVYLRTMRKKQESGPLFTSVIAGSTDSVEATETGKKSEALKRMIDFLARRDFIYMVILLAMIGKIRWFLWMGAVGSPLYFLILLFVDRAGTEKIQRSQPV